MWRRQPPRLLKYKLQCKLSMLIGVSRPTNCCQVVILTYHLSRQYVGVWRGWWSVTDLIVLVLSDSQRCQTNQNPRRINSKWSKLIQLNLFYHLKTSVLDDVSRLFRLSDSLVRDDAVLDLQQQLHEKDMKLTEIRLESLSSVHQLEQLRETMNRMKVRHQQRG